MASELYWDFPDRHAITSWLVATHLAFDHKRNRERKRARNVKRGLGAFTLRVAPSRATDKRIHPRTGCTSTSEEGLQIEETQVLRVAISDRLLLASVLKRERRLPQRHNRQRTRRHQACFFHPSVCTVDLANTVKVED
ncbi:hypothetical protein TGRUB_464955 [Toxoplasma gondii RUB]|uniref:Uncharacterized protein n=2 Tax=Toxoplasma gondii TaxID=5811 RepID=A0A086LX00_TOXGO|nr:hypothetical protein TGRUB_464955 [Toxoplasma gondii RUB]KFH14594.1 putative transmembrane protein [Toxoplasma gondii MAS]